MADQQRDREDDVRSDGTPDPLTQGGTAAHTRPGTGTGSPGGAVSGEIGAGDGVADPGGADLAGDADLGSGEDPLRTQTAGGENSA